MSFPRYPKYKDSDVEWLGDVPEHWGVKRLKRILRLLTEKTDRRGNPVALENIESWTGRYISTETEFEGEGVAFNLGDILFGKLRPYLAKVYRAEESGEAVGDFHVMRPGVDTDSRFAQYQILSREFIEIVDGSTFGTKMPRASWEFVGAIQLTVPPLDEQKVIVAFLDRETTKIDELVAEQRRLIELLKEKRQAVISYTVIKGLNPLIPTKPSEIEWLGDIPTHWSIKSLSMASKRISVGLATSVTQFYRDVGVPIIRNMNIKEGYFDDSDMLYLDETFAEAQASKSVRTGDIIVVHTGSNLGLACIVPDKYDQCHTFTTLIVTPKNELLNRYFTYCMNSAYGKAEVDRLKFGFGKDNLNVREFKCFVTLLPSREEQASIATFLDRETAMLDALIAEAQRGIDLLQERRTALISAAVTGKIDVRGLAPTEAA